MINTDTFNIPRPYSPLPPAPSMPSMTGQISGYGSTPITPPPGAEGPTYPKPKKKFPLKYVLAGLITFLLVVGLGAGYWLSQQSQDIRQQAYLVPATCGDGTCSSGETASSCAADCAAPTTTCGNNTCEAGETATSCPADCGTGGTGGNSCYNAPGGETTCPAGWTWQAYYYAGPTCGDEPGEVCGTGVCCPGPDVITGTVCYPGSAANSYADREVQCGCGTNGGYLCKSDGSGWESTCTNNMHACGETYNGCSATGDCLSLGYGSGTQCINGQCVTSAGRTFDGCGGPNDCYNCWIYADGHRECLDEPTSCGQKAICTQDVASPTPPVSPPASNPPASNPPASNPPGESPTPPVGPQCLSIAISNENPRVGEAVTFTCGNVTGAAKYQFRVGNVASPSAARSLVATGRVSETFVVTDAGKWFAQCRICTGQADSTCQPYESVPQ